MTNDVLDAYASMQGGTDPGRGLPVEDEDEPILIPDGSVDDAKLNAKSRRLSWERSCDGAFCCLDALFMNRD